MNRFMDFIRRLKLPMLAESLLIALPLPLLYPPTASLFADRFFGILSVNHSAWVWPMGLCAGLAGYFGLRGGSRGLAWLCFCMIYGIAVTRAAGITDPDLEGSPFLLTMAIMEMGVLFWMSLLILTSLGQSTVAKSCRMLTAIFAFVPIAIGLVQFAVLQLHGVVGLLKTGLLMRVLFVRDNDQVFTEALRLSGPFQNPNTLGCAVVLAWPALFVWKYPLHGIRLTAVLTPAAAALVVAATYSRAAYLGLAAQIFLFAGFAFWHGCRTALGSRFLVAMMLLIAGFAAGMVLPRVGDRVMSMTTNDASITNRLDVYTGAVEILLQRPFQGPGVSAFFQLYNRYWKAPHLTYDYPDVHSSILNAILEVGLIGASLFVIAIFGSGNRFKSGNCEISPVVYWAIPGLFGAVIPLLCDNFSVIPGVLVPLAASLTAIAVSYSASMTTVPKYLSRRGHALKITGICFLFLVWVLLHFAPKRSALEQLEFALKREAETAPGKVHYYVFDGIRNMEWALHPDKLVPAKGMRDLKLVLAVEKTLGTGNKLNWKENAGPPVSASQLSITDNLFKLIREGGSAARNYFENVIGLEDVDRIYRNFAAEQGESLPKSDSVTSKLNMSIFKHLLKEDLQGRRSIYQDLFANNRDSPLALEISEYSTLSCRFESGDSEVLHSIFIVADSRHRWGAAVSMTLDNRQGAVAVEEGKAWILKFLFRCHRALQ